MFINYKVVSLLGETVSKQDPELVEVEEGIPDKGRAAPSEIKQLLLKTLYSKKVDSAEFKIYLDETRNQIVFDVKGRVNRTGRFKKELENALKESMAQYLWANKVLFDSYGGHLGYEVNMPTSRIHFGPSGINEKDFKKIQTEFAEDLKDYFSKSPREMLKTSKKEIVGGLAISAGGLLAAVALPVVGFLAVDAYQHLGEIGSGVKTAITSAVGHVGEITGIREALSDVSDGAQAVYDSVSTVVAQNELIQGIHTNLSSYATTIGTEMTSAKNEITTMAAEAGELLGETGVYQQMQDYLDTARGTLSSLGAGLVSTMASVQAVVNEADGAITQVNAELSRLKSPGVQFNWSGASPNNVSADADNDGTPDIFWDADQGEYVYDMDSGNELLEAHRIVNDPTHPLYGGSLTTDYEYMNAANIVESYCKSYEELLGNKTSLDTIKTTAQSVYSDLDTAATDIDSVYSSVVSVGGDGTETANLLDDAKTATGDILTAAGNADTALSNAETELANISTKLTELDASRQNIDTYLAGMSTDASAAKAGADSVYTDLGSVEAGLGADHAAISSGLATDNSSITGTLAGYAGKFGDAAKGVLLVTPVVYLSHLVNRRRRMSDKKKVRDLILQGDFGRYKGNAGYLAA